MGNLVNPRSEARGLGRVLKVGADGFEQFLQQDLRRPEFQDHAAGGEVGKLCGFPHGGASSIGEGENGEHGVSGASYIINRPGDTADLPSCPLGIRASWLPRRAL